MEGVREGRANFKTAASIRKGSRRGEQAHWNHGNM